MGLSQFLGFILLILKDNWALTGEVLILLHKCEVYCCRESGIKFFITRELCNANCLFLKSTVEGWKFLQVWAQLEWLDFVFINGEGAELNSTLFNSTCEQLLLPPSTTQLRKPDNNMIISLCACPKNVPTFFFSFNFAGGSLYGSSDGLVIFSSSNCRYSKVGVMCQMHFGTLMSWLGRMISCELKRQIRFCAYVVMRIWFPSSTIIVCVLCRHFSVVIDLRGNESKDSVKIWSISGERSVHNTLYLLYPFLPPFGPWTKGNSSERQLLKNTSVVVSVIPAVS